MGAGRVLVGTLFCLVAAILIVFFVTLGASLEDYAVLTEPLLYKIIFAILMHPYTAVTTVTPSPWSVLAALAAGALFGGLVAKGAKAGLGAALLSWVIIFVVYIGIVYTFNFGDMISSWNSFGILSIVLDIAMGLGILVVVAVIGGAMTGGGE